MELEINEKIDIKAIENLISLYMVKKINNINQYIKKIINYHNNSNNNHYYFILFKKKLKINYYNKRQIKCVFILYFINSKEWNILNQ